jgi:putative endonuclease
VASDYRVYVLRNPAQKFYIGVSDDVERRLQQHNADQSQWTKGKGPWHLAWTSEATSLSEARKLENLLKRQKGGCGFYRITGIAGREMS